MLRGCVFSVLDVGPLQSRSALSLLLDTLGCVVRAPGATLAHGVNLIVVVDCALSGAELSCAADEACAPIITEAWARACAAAGHYVSPASSTSYAHVPRAHAGAIVLTDADAIFFSGERTAVVVVAAVAAAPDSAESDVTTAADGRGSAGVGVVAGGGGKRALAAPADNDLADSEMSVSKRMRRGRGLFQQLAPPPGTTTTTTTTLHDSNDMGAVTGVGVGALSLTRTNAADAQEYLPLAESETPLRGSGSGSESGLEWGGESAVKSEAFAAASSDAIETSGSGQRQPGPGPWAIRNSNPNPGQGQGLGMRIILSNDRNQFSSGELIHSTRSSRAASSAIALAAHSGGEGEAGGTCMQVVALANAGVELTASAKSSENNGAGAAAASGWVFATQQPSLGDAPVDAEPPGAPLRLGAAGAGDRGGLDLSSEDHLGGVGLGSGLASSPLIPPAQPPLSSEATVFSSLSQGGTSASPRGSSPHEAPAADILYDDDVPSDDLISTFWAQIKARTPIGFSQMSSWGD